MKVINKDNKTKVEIVDELLKFCYNFPMDIKDRFIKYYGESLGTHFYKKFKGYTENLPNTYYGMLKCYTEMSLDNRRIFHKLINEYYR